MFSDSGEIILARCNVSKSTGMPISVSRDFNKTSQPGSALYQLLLSNIILSLSPGPGRCYAPQSKAIRAAFSASAISLTSPLPDPVFTAFESMFGMQPPASSHLNVLVGRISRF